MHSLSCPLLGHASSVAVPVSQYFSAPFLDRNTVDAPSYVPPCLVIVALRALAVPPPLYRCARLSLSLSLCWSNATLFSSPSWSFVNGLASSSSSFLCISIVRARIYTYAGGCHVTLLDGFIVTRGNVFSVLLPKGSAMFEGSIDGVCCSRFKHHNREE